MKKILITTIHPAPYFDAWIESLEKEYELIVVYNYKKSAAKLWNNYVPHEGIYLSEINLFLLTKMVIYTDFIVLGGWFEFSNLIIILIALLFHKKLACFSDYPTEIRKKSIKWFLKYLFFHSCIKYILCATESTREYYSKVYKYNSKKLKLFPYGTDFHVPKLSKFNRERQIKITSGEKIKIFTANNFRERKGYKTLFEAFELLKKRSLLDEFEIYIAGAGDEFEYYKEKINSLVTKIILLGWIETGTYHQMMNEADVYVHASYFEPFGIPPIDAMKRGKCVIVSDGIKSTDKLIIDKYNGYIFKAKNSESLFQTLLDVIQNKNMLYEIGKRGKKSAEKIYNSNIYLDSIRDIINE